MGIYELSWGIGILVLLAALIWGTVQYKTRNKANDRITEEATAAQYKDPDNYEQKRAELNKRIKPS